MNIAGLVRLAAVAKLGPEQEASVGVRNGWSLRDLVRDRLGDGARVTALVGEDGARVELDVGLAPH